MKPEMSSEWKAEWEKALADSDDGDFPVPLDYHQWEMILLRREIYKLRKELREAPLLPLRQSE